MGLAAGSEVLVNHVIAAWGRVDEQGSGDVGHRSGEVRAELGRSAVLVEPDPDLRDAEHVVDLVDELVGRARLHSARPNLIRVPATPRLAVGAVEGPEVALDTEAVPGEPGRVGSTPREGAGEMAQVAAAWPRPASIWTRTPPNE